MAILLASDGFVYYTLLYCKKQYFISELPVALNAAEEIFGSFAERCYEQKNMIALTEEALNV